MLVTMDTERREIRGGGLFVRDGVIEQVGETAVLQMNSYLRKIVHQNGLKTTNWLYENCQSNFDKKTGNL